MCPCSAPLPRSQAVKRVAQNKCRGRKLGRVRGQRGGRGGRGASKVRRNGEGNRFRDPVVPLVKSLAAKVCRYPPAEQHAPPASSRDWLSIELVTPAGAMSSVRAAIEREGGRVCRRLRNLPRTARSEARPRRPEDRGMARHRLGVAQRPVVDVGLRPEISLPRRRIAPRRHCRSGWEMPASEFGDTPRHARRERTPPRKRGREGTDASFVAA